MRYMAAIVAAGAVVAMAGSASALTPSRNPHRATHVQHAAHQPKAERAQPAPQSAPGPKVEPDPENFEHVM